MSSESLSQDISWPLTPSHSKNREEKEEDEPIQEKVHARIQSFPIKQFNHQISRRSDPLQNHEHVPFPSPVARSNSIGIGSARSLTGTPAFKSFSAFTASDHGLEVKSTSTFASSQTLTPAQERRQRHCVHATICFKVTVGFLVGSLLLGGFMFVIIKRPFNKDDTSKHYGLFGHMAS
jgi:hypothetical protein